MLDLKNKTNVYLYIDTSHLDIDENFMIQTSQIYVFKYRINGGSWITDTTSGLASRFRVYNSAYEIVLKNGSVVTINDGDIVELFFSMVLTISPSDYLTNNNNYAYIVRNSIIDAIEITFYEFTGEQDSTIKGLDLDNDLIIYGQFTEECNVLNPSIILQYNGNFTWNYLLISSLQRYYFITDVTCVRKGIWRISAHVDVLFTYSSDIHQQSAYIVRNQKNPYGVILPDDRVSFFAEP